MVTDGYSTHLSIFSHTCNGDKMFNYALIQVKTHTHSQSVQSKNSKSALVIGSVCNHPHIWRSGIREWTGLKECESECDLCGCERWFRVIWGFWLCKYWRTAHKAITIHRQHRNKFYAQICLCLDIKTRIKWISKCSKLISKVFFSFLISLVLI